MKRQLNNGKGLSIVESMVVEGVRFNEGISIDWTSDEQSIFEYLIRKYALEVPIVQYAKVAQALLDKTVRDIVMRNRWMLEKEKRKKGNTFGAGIFSNKSIVGGSIGRLVECNAQVLDQIDANLSDMKIQENIDQLCQARNNILIMLNDLSETIYDGMLPFPFKINQQLVDSILPPASLPKK